MRTLLSITPGCSRGGGRSGPRLDSAGIARQPGVARVPSEHWWPRLSGGSPVTGRVRLSGAWHQGGRKTPNMVTQSLSNNRRPFADHGAAVRANVDKKPGHHRGLQPLIE
ncbi:hypothetical protein MRX96_049731 [Rhipicephalus microplus]